MHKMIGIVGGVGSYAGIDLIRKIYDYTEAKTDQEHLPVSMLSAPHKILDRTQFLLGEIQENPGTSIAEIIHTLTLNGAEVIGIPCNTAHAPAIFEEVQRNIPPHCKLLHLVEEVGKHLQQAYPHICKVGVLCTNGTYQTGIYSQALSRFDIEVLHPLEDIQRRLVHPAIYNPEYGIKAFSSPVQEKALQDLMLAATHLCERGAQAIILGCTEIPLAIRCQQIQGRVVIDATAILAKALIRESTNNAEG